MKDDKIKEWEAQIEKYKKISSDASLLVSQISLMMPEINKASAAFEFIIITDGQPYDNGGLTNYKDNLNKASKNFNSLIEECNFQIAKLQSKISDYKIKQTKKTMEYEDRILIKKNLR